MGMFDYIRCEMPLPETDIMPGTIEFQTKDTPDQGMTLYTIKADGRIYWKPYEMVSAPKSERPYPDAAEDDFRSIFGSITRKEKEEEAIDLHGDISFYEFADGNWWEYRARFTEGVCSKIDLVRFEPKHPLPAGVKG